MDNLLDGIQTGIQNASTTQKVLLGTATGLIVGGGATALVLAKSSSSSKKKSSKKKKKGKLSGRARDRKFISKQKHERAYQRVKKRKKTKSKQKYYKHKKSKSSKRKGVHYTKKGQPYILLSNGKARFIKKKRSK